MKNIKKPYFIIIGDTFLKYERSEGSVWSFQKFNLINESKKYAKKFELFKSSIRSALAQNTVRHQNNIVIQTDM